MQNKQKLFLVFVLLFLFFIGLIIFKQNQFNKFAIFSQKTPSLTTNQDFDQKNTTNKIDQNQYDVDSLATKIQNTPELHSKFQEKALNSEFCFEKKLNEEQSEIRCFVPSEILDRESLFEKELKDFDQYEREDSIYNLSFQELPKSEQFFVLLHRFETNQYQEIKKNLETKYLSGNYDVEDLKALRFIKTLEGKYKEGQSISEKNCQKFKVQCEKDVNLILQGKVTDQNGQPIPSALIEILNDSTQNFQTDINGFYEIKMSVYNLTKIRIKASKLGYSEGVIPLIINGFYEQTHTDLNFVLNTPAKVVTINNATKTFSGEGVTIENDAFVIQTEWNQYMIPFNSLVHKDKTFFYGEVDVFLFEFDKSSNIDTLLRNDVFAEIVGYAGNIMKTFGMPYVLFKTKTDGSIHVLKSNPIILKSQIMEMEALKTNQDKIYEPLTQEDLSYLLLKSQELGGYPIDLSFLTNPEKLMVRFPAFWVFDQSVGIWENVGQKLLDIQGLTEVEFYTLNDLK